MARFSGWLNAALGGLEMQTGEATIRGVQRGHVYFAEVSVSIDASASATGIEVACTGKGFTSQGYFEDASAAGYDDWKAAARSGVKFAIGIANFGGIATIRRITGISTDTNLTTIVVAAAHAFWQAAGFAPSAETTEFLQSQLVESLGGKRDQLPEL